MAINTNTTKTVGRTSTVLGSKCDATEKNMAALAKKAGVKNVKMETVMIPLLPGDKDDVIYVGLNGVDFYLRRGRTMQMPAQVKEILQNTGVLPKPEKSEKAMAE